MSHSFDWADLAFGSKKPLNELRATFIAAPRVLSAARLTQLVRIYLPLGNIILGLAKEPYVMGFEGQPQFRTLRAEAVAEIMAKVAAASTPHQIYSLSYRQREFPYILEKLDCQRLVLVNGSWKYTFHTRPAFYTLVKRSIPYELVSPFCDEGEAKLLAETMAPEIAAAYPISNGTYSDEEMMALTTVAAAHSYDYSHQTGVVVGTPQAGHYKLLGWSHNKVIPYESFALHHGGSRERNFSPPHDLNHYDTVHAEVEMLLTAQKTKLDLKGAALFINLLPCSACARMLADSDITELVYGADHSKGYAVKLFELAGKRVRRMGSLEETE